jgi:uncharacterized protein YbjT (DUF2867 family)
VSRGKDPDDVKVRDIASKDITTVQPDATIDDALRTMRQNKVRRLPVVEEDGRLVGILAQADVARHADAERTGEGLAVAMRQNRIARVVFQSSIGAELRHGAGFIDGLARIEQRLDAAREETGAALLHLRCGYFMTNLLHELDGLRAGRLTTIRPLDEPMPWVDPRDIATVATTRLLGDDWTGRQVQAVHGPADLTWTEVAAALSIATGRSIEAQRISDDEERAALRDAGMGEVAVEGIMGMGVGTREGFTPEQPRSVLTTTPSSLAGWAITHLRPAL